MANYITKRTVSEVANELFSLFTLAVPNKPNDHFGDEDLTINSQLTNKLLKLNYTGDKVKYLKKDAMIRNLQK